MVSITQLLTGPISALLVTFFNVDNFTLTFVTVKSEYRESKYGMGRALGYASSAAALRAKYDLPFNWNGSTKIVAQISNPDRIQESLFYSRAFQRICDWIDSTPDKSKVQKEILLALLVPRGPIDVKRGYIAPDIRPDTPEFIQMLDVILRKSGLRVHTDINTSHPPKASQVRPDIWFVYNNLLDDFKTLNPYKGFILERLPNLQ